MPHSPSPRIENHKKTERWHCWEMIAEPITRLRYHIKYFSRHLPKHNPLFHRVGLTKLEHAITQEISKISTMIPTDWPFRHNQVIINSFCCHQVPLYTFLDVRIWTRCRRTIGINIIEISSSISEGCRSCLFGEKIYPVLVFTICNAFWKKQGVLNQERTLDESIPYSGYCIK